MKDETGELREVLDHIRQDPVWQQLWQHILDARQDVLIRMAGVENWDQYLLTRGEFNAINMLLEWGDTLADRLEEATRHRGENGGRREA